MDPPADKNGFVTFKNSFVTFTAKVIDAESPEKLNLKWTVSKGTIYSGQGTQTLVVTGFDDSLTATLEVEGLPQSCLNTASCTFIWCPAAPKRKFDMYIDIAYGDEKVRLDNYAIELQNDPGAQGYLIAYGIKPDRRSKTERWLDRAKDYLIKRHKIDEGRIVTIYGGYRKERELELWVVPSGAAPPTASPTVR